MPQLLQGSPFVAIIVFLAAFVSDALLTVRGARLYKSGAQQIIELEGSHEINPALAKQVDRLSALRAKFVAMLGVYSFAILVIWYLSVRLSWFPVGYPFFVGAILLPQGPIHLRHLSNIAAFKHAIQGDGIEGRIPYSRRFSNRLPEIELASSSGFYLILAILGGSVLLLGGSFGTALLALRSYMGRRRSAALA